MVFPRLVAAVAATAGAIAVAATLAVATPFGLNTTSRQLHANSVSGRYVLEATFEPRITVGANPGGRDPCPQQTEFRAQGVPEGDLTVPFNQLSEGGLACDGRGRIILLRPNALVGGTINPTFTQSLEFDEREVLAQLNNNELVQAVTANLPSRNVRVGLYTDSTRTCQSGNQQRVVATFTLVVAARDVQSRVVGVAGQSLNLPGGTLWMTFKPGGAAGLFAQDVCIYRRVDVARRFGQQEDGVCFPADATVERRDGAVVRLADVAVGDEVRVAPGSGPAAWSPVYMFTHKLARGAHTFVEMTTAAGAVLTATPSHLVYASGARVPAGTVAVGDALEVIPPGSPAGEAVSSRVVAVRHVVRGGLVNPQTLHGDVVVNGVRASTWTTAVEPAVASGLLAPVRAAFRVAGVDASRGVLEGGWLHRWAWLLPGVASG